MISVIPVTTYRFRNNLNLEKPNRNIYKYILPYINMKKIFVTKSITIREDQEIWLKKKGIHLNLSGLVQKIIDEEMLK